uniref:Uncharacterized protein n=1 Tax=Arundo donax TaxID=35708 RepID=A0A0A8Y4M1_ARUDO
MRCKNCVFFPQNRVKDYCFVNSLVELSTG